MTKVTSLTELDVSGVGQTVSASFYGAVERIRQAGPTDTSSIAL
jgi:hypothetical protein